MHEDPVILLDGVPLKSADEIMRFDPRKIRKLEVVTRPYYLGPSTFRGIVSYTTYGGDLAGFELDPHAVKVDYEGLQLRREFYSPRYEAQKERSDRTPDQRNLLFWDPDVTTGGDGKVEFDFYTSDVEGDFLIVIEGLANGGLFGSGKNSFTVKRFDN
jgi:hypothetical protein